MIDVTRLDGTAMVVNCDHILTIEQTPDTVLALTTGVRVMVKETAHQLVEKVISFRRRFWTEGPPIAQKEKE